MQIILEDSDLREMSEDLKSAVLRHVFGNGQSEPDETGDEFVANGFRYATFERGGQYRPSRQVVVLNEKQATDLVAETINRRLADTRKEAGLPQNSEELPPGAVQEFIHPLRLYRAFAYVADGDEPTPALLAEILELDDTRRLGPYLGSITSALKRLSQNKEASLYAFDTERGVYVVHPDTRVALRAGVEVMKRMLLDATEDDPDAKEVLLTESED